MCIRDRHRQLAEKYRRAVKNGRISESQKQEAEALTAANQLLQAETRAEVEARKKIRKDEAGSKIMGQIRTLGYIPKYTEHRQLARKYHKAVKDGKISSLDQEEAKKLTPAQYGR